MQLICIMIELDNFLKDKFSLGVVGSSMISVDTPLDRYPHLVEYEQRLLEDTSKTDPVIAYGLNKKVGIEFTLGLGNTSVFELVIPGLKSFITGKPQSMFATITPDSDIRTGKLSIAYLGKPMGGASVWVPDHLNPDNINPASDRLEEDMEDVVMYLSAFNQMCTVGEHETSNGISVVDPRHLLNAMAEFNVGSNANNIIKNENPATVAHIGDKWEQKRQMMGLISAQDIKDPENDLIWGPTSPQPITLKTTDTARIAIRITGATLDSASFVNDKIRTIKANKKGALEQVQRMGFVTLVKKNQTDNLARRVDQKIV